MQLKIEYVPTEDLKPYANNAKLHPAEQIEQIKSSIRQFGFNDPVAVWKDNEIIEGHGRLIAAEELGLDTVPIIRLDSLTDEQRRAYALVHNKLTMNSGFDFDLLQIELESIELDMSEFDFEIDESTWTPIEGHNPNNPPVIPHIEPQFTPNGVINGAADGTDPYLPEQYNDDEIQEYIDRQESFTIKKRVIITYLPEFEQKLCEMLHIPAIEKIVYDIEELK